MVCWELIWEEDTKGPRAMESVTDCLLELIKIQRKKCADMEQEIELLKRQLEQFQLSHMARMRTQRKGHYREQADSTERTEEDYDTCDCDAMSNSN